MNMHIKREMPGYYRFSYQGVAGTIRRFDSIEYKGLPLYNRWIVEFDNGDYSDTVPTLNEAKLIVANK